MHCVIDAVRSRRLNDPAYRAIPAAVPIFGGLDPDVSFVFGGALFGCFGPGAQQDVWKSSVTDFVGVGYLCEQPRQHDQARSSHVLKLPPCAPSYSARQYANEPRQLWPQSVITVCARSKEGRNEQQGR